MNAMMPPPGGMPPGGAPGQPQDMDALIQALMQQNPQLAQQLMGGGGPPGMGAAPMAMPLMGSGPAMMPQPRPSQGYQP